MTGPAPADPTDGRADLATRAARGTLWLALGAVVSKGVQTIVLVVVARILAPRDLGVLAIAALVVNTLQVLNDLGVTDALTFRKDRIEEAARTALTIMLGVGTVATVLAWLTAPWLARYFRAPDAVAVIRGFAVVLIMDSAATVPLALMERELDFRRRLLPDAVPALIGGAVTVALVIAGHGLAALVAGMIVQGVTSAVLAWAVGYRCWPGWDGGLAADILRFGTSVTGGSVVFLVLLNVDYLIVGRRLDSVALGVYSLAFRVCYLPYIAVAVVVNGAAFPFYCRLPSRRDVAEAVPTVAAAVVFLTVPLFAAAALLAPHVVVLGDKWSGAVAPIRLLAVYGEALSLALTAQVVLKAVGRPALMLASRLVHLVALAAALLVTVSHGLAAVAATQAAVAALVAIITTAVAVRLVGVGVGALVRPLLPPLWGVLAMAAVILGAGRVGVLAEVRSWPAAIALSALG
ncbi:MAG: hypothetical protein QOG64_2884, partial [Acidimicrobiaceae bacterium]|nr:hypothetical protein [Acidimicrobiaceae bacterium]